MIPLRLARELTYQLEQAGEHERLVAALGELPVFVVLFDNEQAATLTQWRTLSKAGCDPEVLYRSKIRDPRLGRGNLYGEALHRLQLFFRSRSALDVMSYFVGLRLDFARASSDSRWETEMLRLLGWIELEQGRLVSAMELLTQSKDRAEEHDDKLALARVLGDIGNVHYERGEHGMSRDYWARQLELSETISYGNGISVASGNLAIEELHRGDFEQAIAYRRKELRIEEQAGDLVRVASCLGGMGQIYEGMGNFEEAERCFLKAARLCEDLGNLNNLGLILGNYGASLMRRREPARAILLIRRALELHRSINYRYGVSYWLVDLVQVLFDLGEQGSGNSEEGLDEVEHLLKECVALSREISNPETEHQAEVLFHRYYLAKGDRAAAIAALEAILAKSTDKVQLARVHHALWKITGAEDTRQMAIAAFEELFAGAPLAEYKETLAELRSEPVPKSTNDLNRQ